MTGEMIYEAAKGERGAEAGSGPVTNGCFCRREWIDDSQFAAEAEFDDEDEDMETEYNDWGDDEEALESEYDEDNEAIVEFDDDGELADEADYEDTMEMDADEIAGAENSGGGGGGGRPGCELPRDVSSTLVGDATDVDMSGRLMWLQLRHARHLAPAPALVLDRNLPPKRELAVHLSCVDAALLSHWLGRNASVPTAKPSVKPKPSVQPKPSVKPKPSRECAHLFGVDGIPRDSRR